MNASALVVTFVVNNHVNEKQNAAAEAWEKRYVSRLWVRFAEFLDFARLDRLQWIHRSGTNCHRLVFLNSHWDAIFSRFSSPCHFKEGHVANISFHAIVLLWQRDLGEMFTRQFWKPESYYYFFLEWVFSVFELGSPASFLISNSCSDWSPEHCCCRKKF